MGQFIELVAADGFVFPAYVAEPLQTPRASVVIVQEIFGVNAHIRSIADGFAAEGYLAIAPSVFHRVKPGVELGYSKADMDIGFALKKAAQELPAPGVLLDVQAAVMQGQRAGKVGVVGFCWGGLLTWQAVCTLEGIAAAVTYYGGGMTEPPDAPRVPRAPVMAHFGDNDPWIALDTIEAFRRNHPEVEVHLYGCGHGFNCDQRSSFNSEAARLARQRTRTFFTQHLAA